MRNHFNDLTIGQKLNLGFGILVLLLFLIVALIFAAGENFVHGVKRSAADKRKAVTNLLRHCPDMSARGSAGGPTRSYASARVDVGSHHPSAVSEYGLRSFSRNSRCRATASGCAPATAAASGGGSRRWGDTRAKPRG